MDIQSYLESGILELYALGQLQGPEKDEVSANLVKYPELRAEFQKIEILLENFALSAGIEPPATVKENLIRTIFGNSENDQMLPVLNKDSDFQEWLRYISQHLPADPQSGCFNKVISQTEKAIQVLIVSYDDFEDEIHTTEIESFLILDGTCKCTVGDSIFLMEPGDFMEIPLHLVHRVEIMNAPVTAIMQRQYI